ncbi:uncharacterized protein [Spinacia oleracea]|uniref:THH1/TOM1/TOM3 domain-containing protein n=1 Tax=Spinacia oleracea TaxID=3562 RepID=A0A9R0K4W0_SPIOL|nr:uncharacterized protein LOC110797757 [Spinacia oleracea]
MAYNKLSIVISSEWTTFWLLKLAYLIFHLSFSLLSTSAVVYTVACIYTGKEITFKKIMSVVPYVWKRLFVTFLCNIGVIFVYNLVWLIESSVVVLVWYTLIFPDGSPYGVIVRKIIVCIILITYLLGFAYISVIWQLASVISVLEDTYGIQAMLKSKDLIKGKIGIAISMFLIFNFCLLGIEILFEISKVINWAVGIGGEISYGMMCLVLLTWLFLFGLVVQTVIYFVCKSYHHERIDKSSLADHLGEYVPLNSKYVQLDLELFNV